MKEKTLKFGLTHRAIYRFDTGFIVQCVFVFPPLLPSPRSCWVHAGSSVSPLLPLPLLYASSSELQSPDKGSPRLPPPPTLSFSFSGVRHVQAQKNRANRNRALRQKTAIRASEVKILQVCDVNSRITQVWIQQTCKHHM